MSQQGGNQFSAQGSGTTSYPLTPYNPFPPQVIVQSPGSTTAPEPEPTEAGETTAMSNVDFLRLILQEVIPDGMYDTDTLFLDQHLVEILNRSNNVLSVAAWMGWMIKAGALAVLTDRNDGLAEKKLSQAAANAEKIAQMWETRAQADLASMANSVAPGIAAFRPYDSGWSDIWNQVWDVSHIDRFYLPWNVIEG